MEQAQPPEVADDVHEALDEHAAERQPAAVLGSGGGTASASISNPAARVVQSGRSPFARLDRQAAEARTA